MAEQLPGIPEISAISAPMSNVAPVADPQDQRQMQQLMQLGGALSKAAYKMQKEDVDQKIQEGIEWRKQAQGDWRKILQKDPKDAFKFVNPFWFDGVMMADARLSAQGALQSALKEWDEIPDSASRKRDPDGFSSILNTHRTQAFSGLVDNPLAHFEFSQAMEKIAPDAINVENRAAVARTISWGISQNTSALGVSIDNINTQIAKYVADGKMFNADGSYTVDAQELLTSFEESTAASLQSLFEHGFPMDRVHAETIEKINEVMSVWDLDPETFNFIETALTNVKSGPRGQKHAGSLLNIKEVLNTWNDGEAARDRNLSKAQKGLLAGKTAAAAREVAVGAVLENRDTSFNNARYLFMNQNPGVTAADFDRAVSKEQEDFLNTILLDKNTTSAEKEASAAQYIHDSFTSSKGESGGIFAKHLQRLMFNAEQVYAGGAHELKEFLNSDDTDAILLKALLTAGQQLSSGPGNLDWMLPSGSPEASTVRNLSKYLGPASGSNDIHAAIGKVFADKYPAGVGISGSDASGSAIQPLIDGNEQAQIDSNLYVLEKSSELSFTAKAELGISKVRFVGAPANWFNRVRIDDLPAGAILAATAIINSPEIVAQARREEPFDLKARKDYAAQLFADPTKRNLTDWATLLNLQVGGMNHEGFVDRRVMWEFTEDVKSRIVPGGMREVNQQVNILYDKPSNLGEDGKPIRSRADIARTVLLGNLGIGTAQGSLPVGGADIFIGWKNWTEDLDKKFEDSYMLQKIDGTVELIDRDSNTVLFSYNVEQSERVVDDFFQRRANEAAGIDKYGNPTDEGLRRDYGSVKAGREITTALNKEISRDDWFMVDRGDYQMENYFTVNKVLRTTFDPDLGRHGAKEYIPDSDNPVTWPYERENDGGQFKLPPPVSGQIRKGSAAKSLIWSLHDDTGASDRAARIMRGDEGSTRRRNTFTFWTNSVTGEVRFARTRLEKKPQIAVAGGRTLYGPVSQGLVNLLPRGTEEIAATPGENADQFTEMNRKDTLKFLSRFKMSEEQAIDGGIIDAALPRWDASHGLEPRIPSGDPQPPAPDTLYSQQDQILQTTALEQKLIDDEIREYRGRDVWGEGFVTWEDGQLREEYKSNMYALNAWFKTQMSTEINPFTGELWNAEGLSLLSPRGIQEWKEYFKDTAPLLEDEIYMSLDEEQRGSYAGMEAFRVKLYELATTGELSNFLEAAELRRQKGEVIYGRGWLSKEDKPAPVVTQGPGEQVQTEEEMSMEARKAKLAQTRVDDYGEALVALGRSPSRFPAPGEIFPIGLRLATRGRTLESAPPSAPVKRRKIDTAETEPGTEAPKLSSDVEAMITDAVSKGNWPKKRGLTRSSMKYNLKEALRVYAAANAPVTKKMIDKFVSNYYKEK